MIGHTWESWTDELYDLRNRLYHLAGMQSGVLRTCKWTVLRHTSLGCCIETSLMPSWCLWFSRHFRTAVNVDVSWVPKLIRSSAAIALSSFAVLHKRPICCMICFTAMLQLAPMSRFIFSCSLHTERTSFFPYVRALVVLPLTDDLVCHIVVVSSLWSKRAYCPPLKIQVMSRCACPHETDQ